MYIEDYNEDTLLAQAKTLMDARVAFSEMDEIAIAHSSVDTDDEVNTWMSSD